MAWAPDYITAEELVDYVRGAADVDLDQAADVVAAASRAVDGTCGRQFGQTAAPETRRFESRWDQHFGVYVMQVDDLQNLTGLAVLTASGLDVTASTALMPSNALLKGKPYEELRVPGRGTYDVTATWGWNAVPAAVRQATKLQASRFVARRDSPYGVAGSPSDGTELRLQAKVDPDVEVILRRGKYVRTWWAR